MDTLGYLGQGFGVALTPYNLVTALSGTLIGTVVGLLPGLGPINGVALLIPIAFALGLPPESALILLAAVYLGCEYGGRISSILLNIPGEASTVMTALDGYPMARQGLAGVALSLSAWSSFIGALIATCGMVMFAPLLAKWAIAFGPAEYFVLMVFAIVCLGGMAGDRPLKTFVAALIGLFLSSIGIDANSGVYRFTGDNIHLADGIQFVVLVLGLFFAFGLSFEVPIAVVILSWVGAVNPDELAKKRPYVFVLCFVLGMLLTPPDIISQTLLAVPMFLLFEVGILVASLYHKEETTEATKDIES